MGQSHSSRRSSVSNFSFKHKSSLDSRRRRKRELSHTFNVLNESFQVELININTATEEELMTLPGISRETARHIVEYRQRIGQFKKVEDLAVVSEVGANKLAAIKGEICVNSRRKGLSRSSSCGTPSEESVGAVTNDRSQDSSLHLQATDPTKVCGYVIPGTAQDRLDVNTATMFQLMSIRYISQTMAAGIVHYRDKKGPFKSIDDLVKVKGLSNRLIGELKQHLYVDPEKFASLSFQTGAGGSLGRRRHRRSSSVPPIGSSHSFDNGSFTTNHLTMKVGDGLDNDAKPAPVDNRDIFLSDKHLIYQVLTRHCSRPPIAERFSFMRHQQPAFRVATWNLERLTQEKAQNLGVIEVICCTILENGISLVSFQDLGDQTVLEKICAELNNPTLKKVQERGVAGPRGVWKCEVSEPINQIGQVREHLGFVYDSKRGITLVKADTLNFPPPNNNGPSFPGAFFVTFRSTDNIEFSLLNVHLRSLAKDQLTEDDTPPCQPMTLILKSWLENIRDTAVGLRVIVGDFDCDPSSKDVCILAEQFSSIVPSGILTNSDDAGCKTNPCYDNIWMSSCVKRLYTDRHGIVKQGLRHLAIPDGWSWGGYASSHCPVWAEFFVPSLLSLRVLSNEMDHSSTPSLPNGGIKHLVKTMDIVPDGDNNI